MRKFTKLLSVTALAGMLSAPALADSMTYINQIPTNAGEVAINGNITAINPEQKEFTLRDQTGQIKVNTDGVTRFKVGDQVQVYGTPVTQMNQTQLKANAIQVISANTTSAPSATSRESAMYYGMDANDVDNTGSYTDNKGNVRYKSVAPIGDRNRDMWEDNGEVHY